MERDSELVALTIDYGEMLPGITYFAARAGDEVYLEMLAPPALWFWTYYPLEK